MNSKIGPNNNRLLLRTIFRYQLLRQSQRFRVCLWPKRLRLWIWMQAIHPEKATGRQRNVGIASPSIRRLNVFVATVACAKCWSPKMHSCRWMNWWAALYLNTISCRRSVVSLHAYTSTTYNTKAEVISSFIHIHKIDWILRNLIFSCRPLENCSQK